MRVVAQMLIRNEADVIEEVLLELFKYVNTCVVLDGYSDDGTQEILGRVEKKVATRKKLLRWYSSPDPEERFADHRRNELLEYTAEFEPDWVWSVDGDEIAGSNVMDAIEAAEAAGGNVLICQVPQFWITLDDIRRGLMIEDQTQSIQERRLWYSWGNVGRFIWKWNPAHYYPRDIQKRTPEMLGMTWREWQRPGPIEPVIKHYPFRSLQQTMRRIEERKERGGHKYFGKYYYDVIIDEIAAGLYRYDDHWDTTYNHDRVCAYMGRLESEKLEREKREKRRGREASHYRNRLQSLVRDASDLDSTEGDD